MVPWWKLRYGFSSQAWWVESSAGSAKCGQSLAFARTYWCPAAAIYVLAAQQVALDFGEPVDALRAMAGIAGGVGFLGAGVILRAHGEVRWLTTAAALWADAALGMAAGMGMYFIAALGSALILVDLHCLPRIEKWLAARRRMQRPDVPEIEASESSRPISSIRAGVAMIWPICRIAKKRDIQQPDRMVIVRSGCLRDCVI